MVHFDCIGGASGNMLLGALLDVGAPAMDIERLLRTLPVSDWQWRIETVRRGSIGATHLTVESAERQPQRHLSDIVGILAGLPEPVRGRARRVFERLAQAEAKVHRTGVDEVHFHEVGAVDAIVDIVGTVAALHFLGVDTVSASPLPLGHGLIECQHGTFPNPAPATVELLKGVPTRAVDVAAELVTPTGAALLVGLEARFGAPPPVWDSVGYGAGTRELPWPNVVRVLMGQEAVPQDALTVLETNLDDASPQVYGPLMDDLFVQGALDVTLTPVLMKKNRPGIVISVLCDTARATTLQGLLLRQTTTLGVRSWEVSRARLDRRMTTVQVAGGEARVKLALDGKGEVVKVVPEFDDCLALSRQVGRPLQQVLDEVRAAGWTQGGAHAHDTLPG
ncbi:MAG TPA: nickel pincer cofactor biosynthesis protein LarC [Candidatus Xenobia bacterium]|jgi:hypothetical protein